MTQPASLSQSRELRQVQSQGASCSREPAADLNPGQQTQPELSIKAGKAHEQRAPDWIGHSAALASATEQQKQPLWQTPHASDKWCVQGTQHTAVTLVCVLPSGLLRLSCVYICTYISNAHSQWDTHETIIAAVCIGPQSLVCA